jgi:delta24-sterol reductase
MTKLELLFEHVLTHYCGIFATIFLLPVSAVYGAYAGIRNWIFC